MSLFQCSVRVDNAAKLTWRHGETFRNGTCRRKYETDNETYSNQEGKIVIGLDVIYYVTERCPKEPIKCVLDKGNIK